jgi:hypothetical protein
VISTATRHQRTEIIAAITVLAPRSSLHVGGFGLSPIKRISYPNRLQ